ncbi:MAG: hypothetical protein HGA76_05850, partial [Candidatus Firestonebacteria bacterium]|nr:hypothetical protein [Candidatus Firestonebacteria bacterium]
NDQINVPQVISLGLAQDQYVSLPKKYGATLRLVILQGTQKSPGFYNSEHNSDNPQELKVVGKLAGKVAAAVRNLLER